MKILKWRIFIIEDIINERLCLAHSYFQVGYTLSLDCTPVREWDWRGSLLCLYSNHASSKLARSTHVGFYNLLRVRDTRECVSHSTAVYVTSYHPPIQEMETRRGISGSEWSRMNVSLCPRAWSTSGPAGYWVQSFPTFWHYWWEKSFAHSYTTMCRLELCICMSCYTP